MSDYTPTTEEVRTDYVVAYTNAESSQLLAGMAFDRWIAQHDREVQAAAFDAAAVRVRANFAEHGERCPWVGFLDDEAERLRKDGAA